MDSCRLNSMKTLLGCRLRIVFVNVHIHPILKRSSGHGPRVGSAGRRKLDGWLWGPDLKKLEALQSIIVISPRIS